MIQASSKQQVGKAQYGIKSVFAGSLLVRGLGLILAFSIHLIVVRTLGVEASGLFFVALSVLYLSIVIAKRGYETALLKHAAIAFDEKTKNDSNELAELYIEIKHTIIRSAALVTGCLILFSPLIAKLLSDSNNLMIPLVIIILATLPMSLSAINTSVLKSCRKPVMATLCETVYMPIIFILLIGVLYSLNILNITVICSIFVMAAMAAQFISGIHINNTLLVKKNKLKAINKNSYVDITKNSKHIFPLDIFNWILIYSCIPILSFYSNDTEVGEFSIAHRLVTQISVLLIVCNGIVAPRLAISYKNNIISNVRNLWLNSCLGLTILSLPIVIVFLFYPEIIMMIFGSDFNGSMIILQILTIGQLFNIITGPAGYVLTSCGHEVLLKRIIIISTSITISLSAIFAYQWQAEGMAYAVSTGLIIQNIVTAIFAYKITQPDTERPTASVQFALIEGKTK